MPKAQLINFKFDASARHHSSSTSTFTMMQCPWILFMYRHQGLAYEPESHRARTLREKRRHLCAGHGSKDSDEIQDIPGGASLNLRIK